jgi:hypothetical protein
LQRARRNLEKTPYLAEVKNIDLKQKNKIRKEEKYERK